VVFEVTNDERDSKMIYNKIIELMEKDKTIKKYRPNWDEYFISMLPLISSRSVCLRRKVGCIIVSQDKTIIATGYNSPPAGLKHCEELGGCLRQQMNIPSGERSELCRATHAEANAIATSAKLGIALKNSTIYVYNHPCGTCAKSIITAGIQRVVYVHGYNDNLSMAMFAESDCIVEQYKEV